MYGQDALESVPPCIGVTSYFFSSRGRHTSSYGDWSSDVCSSDLYVAVTRARQRVIVTAVASGDGEEQPSRFLYELSGEDPQEHPASTRLPRALTLPALVAELRGAVADPDLPPDRRRAAAAHLAGLAAAGVAGADPDEWWGLPPLSDERPLRDE